jgi:hypothetical protein
MQKAGVRIFKNIIPTFKQKKVFADDRLFELAASRN